MTNNQFKDAMLMMGYTPAVSTEINWIFKVSSKSRAIQMRKNNYKDLVEEANILDPMAIVKAAKAGIHYPYSTPLDRGICKDFDNELKLYGFVPVMTYDDWTIYRSIRNPLEWKVVDKDLEMLGSDYGIKRVQCIKEAWVTEEEYDASHGKYNSNYFGEFDDSWSLSHKHNGKIRDGWFMTMPDTD